MHPNPTESRDPGITGQLLHVDEHRDVAIYMRDGVVRVAEFRDGQAELIDAASWFSSCVGAAGMSHSKRKRAIDCAEPITPELALRIEALHAARDSETSVETSSKPPLLAGLGVFRTLARFLRLSSEDRRTPAPVRASAPFRSEAREWR